MRKKVLSIVLMAVMAGSMLAGCGGSASSSAASKTASVAATSTASVAASATTSSAAASTAASTAASMAASTGTSSVSAAASTSSTATASQPVASVSNDEKIKAAKAGGEVTIGFSVSQMANPYFVNVKKGVDQLCAKYGYKCTAVDANNDVSKQVTDFENFLNQGVTAVIACPIDSNALVDVTKKMNEAGILVISFAQIVPNANEIFTIDEYSYGVAIGENAAKWINEKLDGKGNVLIISQDNVEAVVKRADGIEDTIKKECPNAVIVARQAGDNAEKGMKITEDVMQAHPEVNVITGNNDSGPLGAIEAVKAMNLSQDQLDKFYIGGADATAEAIAKMGEKGSIYRATVDIAPFVTGEDCVNAIKDIIDKQHIPVNSEVESHQFQKNPVWQQDVLNGWKAEGSE